MLRKKIVIGVTTLGLAAMCTLTSTMAFAQTLTPGSAVKEGTVTQIARLARLHTSCDNDINTRITSLNTLISKINAMVKLSATQKTQFTSQIQTNISGLTTLKGKCDSDTTISTLIADRNAVYSQFRVFAILMPQISLLAAADRMGIVIDQMNMYATKLQTRITNAQTAGNNVANLQTLLSDMQNKIKDAQMQMTNVITQISSLTPANYPATTLLQTARREIKTGTTDLATAWSDAKQIRNGLKSMKMSITPVPTQ